MCVCVCVCGGERERVISSLPASRMFCLLTGEVDLVKQVVGLCSVP